ncbi:MAG: hypothetical protein WB992_07700 [Bryobacteraceae bacterium]
MKRVWQTSAKVAGGLVLTALYAMPQAYTISAKPGAVNYIEGNAYLDGRPISQKVLRATFLNANDTLSTDIGKAEVLLTPGVFLRIGDNSQIRMISPSLTNTQLEVIRGEAMIEAAGLMKDNSVQIIDHGASITLERNGLYRITGDEPPTAGVIDGKASLYLGERKVEIGKGHETVIASPLKVEKFDKKRDDDLYAWSNVRSEYDAAASYQTSTNAAINSYGGLGGYGFDGYGLGGYGFNGFYGSGWLWNNGFSSWAWLPGAGAAFYSPFGFGFYGPAYIGYAPVIYAPVYGGGGGTVTKKPVPVNPQHPPAIGAIAASPSANEAARVQAARSFAASGGFRTASGDTVPVGRSSGSSGSSGVTGSSRGSSGGIAARSSGGGFASSGASHSGGGSGGGGHR